jgi:hypothetical protein
MGYIYIYNMGFEVCGLVVPLVLFLKREARGNYIISFSESNLKVKKLPRLCLVLLSALSTRAPTKNELIA